MKAILFAILTWLGIGTFPYDSDNSTLEQKEPKNVTKGDKDTSSDEDESKDGGTQTKDGDVGQIETETNTILLAYLTKDGDVL